MNPKPKKSILLSKDKVNFNNLDETQKKIQKKVISFILYSILFATTFYSLSKFDGKLLGLEKSKTNKGVYASFTSGLTVIFAMCFNMYILQTILQRKIIKGILDYFNIN